jgi:hypothetical protein
LATSRRTCLGLLELLGAIGAPGLREAVVAVVGVGLEGGPVGGGGVGVALELDVGLAEAGLDGGVVGELGGGPLEQATAASYCLVAEADAAHAGDGLGVLGSAARTRANIASASAYFSSLTRAAPLLRSFLSLVGLGSTGSTDGLGVAGGGAEMRANEGERRTEQGAPPECGVITGPGAIATPCRRPAPTW